VGGSDTAHVIDGFTAVQGVRRSDRRPAGPRFQPSRTTLPGAREARPAPETPGTPPARHIGRSALPARHEIECYMCRYAFVLQGRVGKTVCPKCHEWLNFRDYTIDSEWTGEDVCTIGRIDVAAAAVVREARLTAREISVAGDVTQATVHAFARLELWEGARVDPERLTFRDLLVKSGVFHLKRPLRCRNLEVAGRLRAPVQAEAR
jgi:hypothetical protein